MSRPLSEMTSAVHSTLPTNAAISVSAPSSGAFVQVLLASRGIMERCRQGSGSHQRD
jgi:hypothetical protein